MEYPEQGPIQNSEGNPSFNQTYGQPMPHEANYSSTGASVPPYQNYYQPNYQQYPQQNYFPPQQLPPQPAGKSKAQKASMKKKNKKAFKVLSVFGVVGLIIGVFAFVVVNKYVKQLTVVSLPGAPIITETKKETVTQAADQTASLPEDNSSALAQETQPERWDGKNRITCLAMGLDYRDWVANEGAPRSDTMMLLTYDPVTKEAGMLSLPRDLWVAIPDHGYGRINTAYSMGEGEKLPPSNGYPGGGPGLAMRTVEMFLGVKIQYYAVVDFYGFSDFIDAIDTLAVNVRDDIWVDPLGPGNTVHLMAGVQDLDGPTALAYARYRYTDGGDFERAQRQQDVIFALHKQISWQLPELLTTKFDAVFASIQRAVKTNIPLSDMIKLAWTATDINPYSVKRAVIAPPYQVEYGKTSDGTQDILIPIPDKIREARDSIFMSGANIVQLSDEYTKEDRVRDEAAKVTLLSGCSDVEKVNKTVELLHQYGIQVVSIAAGSYGYTNTMTISTGKPYTAQFLKEMMNIPTSGVSLKYDPAAGTDLFINLTDSWCNAIS